MQRKTFFVLSIGTAMLAGCMTVFNATEAQRALHGKGVGAARQAAEKLDLSGYSLRELVEFAMTNRPSMTMAALAVDDARLALREIAADAPLVSYSPWTSPHLSASAAYSESSAPRNPMRWRTDGNASAGLSLDVLLFDFGRNRAKAAAQVERLIAAEYELVREGYSVFNEVATAYFDVMADDALLEVALTNETEYALHLQQAEAKLAAGEAQKLDVTSARLGLSQAHEDTIVASNEVVTSGAELMRALGVDASRGTRDEVYPASGRALLEVLRGFPDTHYGVETAFELARTNAPAVAIARAKLRAASRAVECAIADLMPSVDAEIGISWADPLWAWHWGVGAVQSVFTGFRKTTAVDRAVVQMESAAAAVDEAEQQLSLRLETAIAVRDNALRKRETARASLMNAQENLDTVKAQYMQGYASRVDFTDSISRYASALGSRVSAFYSGQMAEASLFAIIGRMPEYREETLKEK
ncbi:MAG: TolC family protein [Kiritimatiellae bacterium]|nr:TolC family protein [Kiritimatiellia bacterium]